MSKTRNSNIDSPSEKPPRTPRWVIVFGIIAIIIVLLVVGLKLYGDGQHGPMRHLQSFNAFEQGVNKL